MLISPSYRKQQEELHTTIPGYGVMGAKYGKQISRIMDEVGITHLLDYGCGHNLSLRKTLKPKGKFTYTAYDPGVPEYAEKPEPAEMVACIDVIEHIEPECLTDVLDHLQELTQVLLFATVHTGPANKTLPDGRNAHLIQQPMEWWMPKFLERFKVQGLQRRPTGFELIAFANDCYSG